MENSEFEKSKVFSVADALEYVPNSMVTKVIIREPTGNVCVMAFDTNEFFEGKSIPFDTIIQIIEGKAEIIIDDNPYGLETGQSIIIPTRYHNMIKAS